MANFTEISKKYEQNSVIQKSASKVLFELLDIQENHNVLDLGCGTGHLTKIIREKTKGKVIGVDPSNGMIEAAKVNYSAQDIIFRNISAEQIDYKEEFDIIFCNSAFQWFTDHQKVLRSCYSALKQNGRMAIQAPAKEIYCPNFIEAINAVRINEETKNIFASFNSPWFFLNTAKEYSELFESAGFAVKKAWIDKVVSAHSAKEVYKIFESGAAAGYLNPNCYSAKLSQEYIKNFRKIVLKSFEQQADNAGKVHLIFHRIYLLAIKQ